MLILNPFYVIYTIKKANRNNKLVKMKLVLKFNSLLKNMNLSLILHVEKRTES